MVRSYQLINEYKSWSPRKSPPEASGVAFSQQGNSKAAQRTAEWKKKAVCHNCGKKGHIKPDWIEPIINNDDTNDKDNNNVKHKPGKKKPLKKRNQSNSPTSTRVPTKNPVMKVCVQRNIHSHSTHTPHQLTIFAEWYCLITSPHVTSFATANFWQISAKLPKRCKLQETVVQ